MRGRSRAASPRDRHSMDMASSACVQRSRSGRRRCLRRRFHAAARRPSRWTALPTRDAQRPRNARRADSVPVGRGDGASSADRGREGGDCSSRRWRDADEYSTSRDVRDATSSFANAFVDQEMHAAARCRRYLPPTSPARHRGSRALTYGRLERALPERPVNADARRDHVSDPWPRPRPAQRPARAPTTAPGRC